MTGPGRMRVKMSQEAGMRTSIRQPKASKLSAMLDKIAAELRDAPALSDEAVSRAGIYADQGLVEWLLACPEKGFFVPIESESTDTL